MRVRVLFRTHYQVDQPGHFLLLVQGCTSPVRSDYPEKVASRLAKLADFNVPAALYAVQLARQAEILTDRMVWTPLGLLLALVARPVTELEAARFRLTTAERIAAFRVFLESDGASLLWLAQRLVTDGRLSATEEASNPIAQEMFLDIYDQYLAFISVTRERQIIRAQRDRLKRNGFTGKTGKHKLWLHLEILSHARLCDRYDEQDSRCYALPQDERAEALRLLHKNIPGVLSLEKCVAAGELADVACEVLRTTTNVPAGSSLDVAAVSERLRSTARRIQRFGMTLCPISTLIDAVQIQATAEGFTAPSSLVIKEVIQAMHRSDPKRVRFHVDRNGRPAYLVVEE